MGLEAARLHFPCISIVLGVLSELSLSIPADEDCLDAALIKQIQCVQMYHAAPMVSYSADGIFDSRHPAPMVMTVLESGTCSADGNTYSANGTIQRDGFNASQWQWGAFGVSKRI